MTVVRSVDVAERLFLTHGQLKTLVKTHDIPHKTDGKGGYVLLPEAEEQIAKAMMATTSAKALHRARKAAGIQGAETRKKNEAERKLNEEAQGEGEATTTRRKRGTQA